MASSSRPTPGSRKPIPEHQRASRLARFVRWGVLLVVWAVITHVTVAHQRLGGGPEGAPTVDALCPFGGLATLYRVLAGGQYLQRVFPSSIVLLVGVVLSALILRRAFCGWICPLGAMQELFGAIGRRLRLRKPAHTSRPDAAGRYAKYAVLVLIIALTWATGQLVFRPYDPWAAYAHLSAGWSEIRGEFLVGGILLAVAVLGSVILERSWCRYLCPFGGLLGLIARIGATRVVRDEGTCIHCGRCDRACPVDLTVQDKPAVVSAECLNCGECVAVCPVPQTLGMRVGRRPVPVLAVGILAVAIFFGTVAASKALGLWESRPQSLEQIVGSGAQADPANIRGFMTLNEIAASFGMPAESIIAAAGLPADTPLDKPIKDIMKPLGRETEELREVVAALQATGPAAAPPVSLAPTAPPPAQPAAELTDEDIAGTDTLAAVRDKYHVSVERLLVELKLPADTPLDRPLRDIMRPLGRHVTEVRDAVAKLAADQADAAKTP